MLIKKLKYGYELHDDPIIGLHIEWQSGAYGFLNILTKDFKYFDYSYASNKLDKYENAKQWNKKQVKEFLWNSYNEIAKAIGWE